MKNIKEEIRRMLYARFKRYEDWLNTRPADWKIKMWELANLSDSILEASKKYQYE